MTTALQHADALRDIFTEITQDCLLLDLEPVCVQVSRQHFPFDGWTVLVQFTGEDAAAVDALAESYGFAAGPGSLGGLYERAGRMDVNGLPVEVRAYTGRPSWVVA